MSLCDAGWSPAVGVMEIGAISAIKQLMFKPLECILTVTIEHV